MRTEITSLALIALLATGASAETGKRPLSAIDWLDQNGPVEGVQPVAQPRGARMEPPVTRSGRSPQVTVSPLGSDMRRRLGLLPPDVTGLPPSLWHGSDPDLLHRLLEDAISQRLPAAQGLLLTALLTEADDVPQPEAAMDWLVARIDALIELGAIEPALAMISEAEPARDPELFARWMTLSLLTGEELGPCRVVISRPELAPDEATRIFCTARTGDFETAALLFGTTGALGVLDPEREVLLAHFLDPDLFAGEPLPRAPLRPDALTFRLFAAAGAPLPTAPLPRAFSHVDLSNDAGWKSQLSAAERLARAGVLPANQLLGLYTSHAPAASGGIWDRVSAIQEFDSALSEADADRIAETLPAVWRSMQSAGLEVVFAELYAEPIAAMSLPEPADAIAVRIALLSRDFTTFAKNYTDMPGTRFLLSVARGEPDPALARSDAARAVAEGFSGDNRTDVPPAESGEAILRVLGKLSEAGRGDLGAVTASLRELRALGLDSIARQAALQVLIIQNGA